MRIERTIDQFISGPEGMAGRPGFGGVVLSVDAPISTRRDVRVDISDQTRGWLSAGQHRGRSRTGEYRQLRAAFADLARLLERVGNTSAFGATCGHLAGSRPAAGARALRKLRQDDPGLDTVVARQDCRTMKPFAIRYSLFAKARSAAR